MIFALAADSRQDREFSFQSARSRISLWYANGTAAKKKENREREKRLDL